MSKLVTEYQKAYEVYMNKLITEITEMEKKYDEIKSKCQDPEILQQHSYIFIKCINALKIRYDNYTELHIQILKNTFSSHHQELMKSAIKNFGEK
jgi:ssDNA-binding Zn-finger/Zn-ribbon topoisomerase 1